LDKHNGDDAPKKNIFYQVQYPVNVVINVFMFEKNAEMLWLNVPDEQYLKNSQ